MAKKPSKKKLKEVAIECCGIVKDMADACKASRSQMYRWIEKDPTLKEEIEKARDGLVDIAESNLKKNVEAGKEKSIIYLLGTQGRKRGWGNFIQIQNRDKLDEQLDEMKDDEVLAKMNERLRRMQKANKK